MLLSRVRLFATLWTVAHRAPLSTGFSRQDYWSGWPCPPPEDLPHPGIESTSPVSPALAGRQVIYYKHHLGLVFLSKAHMKKIKQNNYLYNYNTMFLHMLYNLRNVMSVTLLVTGLKCGHRSYSRPIRVLP